MSRARSATIAHDSAAGNGSGSAVITGSLDKFDNAAALVEALWRPTSDWLIRPGVRADVWHDNDTTKPASIRG